MNRLIIPNGGMPLEGDDFRWFQDGYAEAFKGVFSMISKLVSDDVLSQGNSAYQPLDADYVGNFIISGCKIESIGGGNVSVSEGFVFIDGEVLFYPGTGSMPEASPGFDYAFRLLFDYDPTGNEVFQNASSQDTYEIRRAEIYTLSAAPTFPSSKLIQLADLLSYIDIKNPIRDIDGEVSLANGWTGATSILVAKQFGRVYMQGEITPGTWAQPALTLSVGFRPSQLIRQLAPWGNDGLALILIAPTGIVTPRIIITPTLLNNVDLSQINFSIA